MAALAESGDGELKMQIFKRFCRLESCASMRLPQSGAYAVMLHNAPLPISIFA
jgi:hypothetical protein